MSPVQVYEGDGSPMHLIAPLAIYVNTVHDMDWYVYTVAQFGMDGEHGATLTNPNSKTLRDMEKLADVITKLNLLSIDRRPTIKVRIESSDGLVIGNIMLVKSVKIEDRVSDGITKRVTIRWVDV